MTFTTFFQATQAQSAAEAKELMLIENGKPREGWAISTPVEGATFEEGEGFVDFDLEKWREGRDGWPRLHVSGEPVDLSEFTEIHVEIESLSDHQQTLVVAAGGSINPTQLAVGVGRFQTPRQSLVVRINIAEGCGYDPSNTVFLQFYRQFPPETDRYRLAKATAVVNPDFVSARDAMRRRIGAAARAVGRLADGATEGRDEAVATLAGMAANAEKQFQERRPGYIASLAALLDRLDNLTARENMARLGVDRLVWNSPLALAILPDTLPPAEAQSLGAIDLTACRNQYLAYCVNISTIADVGKASMRLKDASREGLFLLRETEFVKARDGTVTADVLHDPSDSVAIGEIPAHETRQVMLWVNTKSSPVAPGAHTAVIEVTLDDETVDIPVALEVLDVALPEQTELMNYAWAAFYHGRSVTPGAQREALENMRDYGMNTWFIEDVSVPLPELGEDGEYQGLFREEEFRRILELVRGGEGERLILWLGYERGEDVHRRFEDVEVIRRYLADMNRLMDEYAIPRESWYFCLSDEPKAAASLAHIEVMQRFKEADPKVLFYNNGSDLIGDPVKRAQFLEALDVWCPNWDHFLGEYLAETENWEEQFPPDLGFYRCLGGRNNRAVNLHEYYRLAFWRCLRFGLGNVAFWAYNSGAAGIDNYDWDPAKDTASGWTVVYFRDGGILSSRRWELVREGFTDYQLFALLQDTSGVVDVRGDPELLELSERVLGDQDDYALADEVRAQLMEMLAERLHANAGENE